MNYCVYIDCWLVLIVNMLFIYSESLLIGCDVLLIVSCEQFNEVKQMLLRNFDSFGCISIFFKEFWFSVIILELKFVFNKFWIKNKYYLWFEKCFNLMLVVVLLI